MRSCVQTAKRSFLLVVTGMNLHAMPVFDVKRRMIQHIVQHAAEAAGITNPYSGAKHVSPHVFRNASAYYTTFQKEFILNRIVVAQLRFAAVYGHAERSASVAARPAASDVSAQ